MPINARPQNNASGLAVYEEGGKVLIRSPVVPELKSIWR
jgi:hypothetical protein